MSMWHGSVNRIRHVLNERTCCDIMLITLGHGKELFTHGRSTSYLPLISDIVFLTIIQLVQEEKIHDVSHLINGRKKGSGC